jgi:hypothetical protein
MSNIVKFFSVPERLAEDERLRLIVQRALAPPDFPFDGLHVEAATVLGQLGLVTELSEGMPKDPENPSTTSAKRHSRN